MDNTFDKTAVETIDLQESRLRRIEYAVGSGHADVEPEISAAKRLENLEHALHQLASKSSVVQDLLRLHARHPDLFQSINADEVPTTLDISSILSIVLASASSYPETASRLSSILDVPIPPAEQSAQLIELTARIARLEAIQESQSAELAACRERSAVAIQKFYTKDILKAGDGWAELEGRVEQVERKVRRAALAKRIDENVVG